MDIYELIKNLNWNRPDAVQKHAINELSISNLRNSEIILLAKQSNDLCSKPCWDNAAIVLKNIGYPRNEVALPYLMEWFQDITWPGVRPIIEMLKEIDNRILTPYIEDASEIALGIKDDCWANGLLYLINGLGISREDFKNVKLFEKLEKMVDL